MRTRTVSACSLLAVACSWLMFPGTAVSQESSAPPIRSSLVEDRAARRLIEAGDTRYEADEATKAVEIWQSVIERYPRSRMRYQAHMKLGEHFLTRERAYDRARGHFSSVLEEENRDQDMQAEATLKTGICFYEASNFGKCFQVMRDVIEKYPVNEQVNEAYYYIGLGHFQLGHYSRAIAALEKVGTSFAKDDQQSEKVEAGKRLFVKIEDTDLAALESGKTVKVVCKTTSGDEEILECYSIGRNVRIVLGNIPTRLGNPIPGNGFLEVKGDDKVHVTYVDAHTADKQFDRPVEREIEVVGDAVAKITDGAFSETLNGVVLGKPVNLQIFDADRDLTDDADTITAVVEIYRQKTDAEIEEELAQKLAEAEDSSILDDDEKPEIDKYKKIDRIEITLTEAEIQNQLEAAEETEGPASTENPEPPAPENTEGENPETEKDTSLHTGIFRATVTLMKTEELNADDNALQALPGDMLRVTYLDRKHTGEGVQQITAQGKCVDGNLGGVRVTRAVITDLELRIQTKLKTASALTNIGNRYKDFGLKANANSKYEQALDVCDEIMIDARKLGGRLLEETYVQLWKIYFQMDKLELAAAMAQRLQREFPNSGFVDDALLQLADVARKQGSLQRAIGIYNRLANMKGSQLRGEAQFGIAQCYGQLAEAQTGNGATQLLDRAFQEYKKVFDQFPESGRVGEAVSKMADYYYQQQDYSRAVDTFETVLSTYPDAKFLDVILFNYGRCLYRMGRRPEARSRFDQLISEFPESPLAANAKKISDALRKAGI